MFCYLVMAELALQVDIQLRMVLLGLVLRVCWQVLIYQLQDTLENSSARLFSGQILDPMTFELTVVIQEVEFLHCQVIFSVL